MEADAWSTHPFAGILGEWLRRLPFLPRMAVLDNYFACGCKIFLRLGCVLLQRWHARLKALGVDEPLGIIATTITNADELLHDMFTFKYVLGVC